MPYCPKCRIDLDDASIRNCPNCGSSLLPAAQKPRSRMRLTGDDAPLGLTRRAFCRGYSSGARNCVLAAWLGYFSVVLLLATRFSDLFSGNLSVLTDAAFLVSLSMLVHVFKNRIAAALFFAYGVFNFLFTLLTVHEITGWLVPLAGVIALIGSFTAAREWKMYGLRSQAVAEELRDSAQP